MKDFIVIIDNMIFAMIMFFVSLIMVGIGFCLDSWFCFMVAATLVVITFLKLRK